MIIIDDNRRREVILNRTYLINEFGNNLYTLNEINCSCHGLFSIPTNEFLTNMRNNILSSFDINKLRNILPPTLEPFGWREPITKINPEAFRGLSNLDALHLSRNIFKKLDANLFEDLCSLKHLHIGECHIAEIDTRAFQGLANLIELHLSDNKLSSIDNVNLFNGVPKLERLYLHSNTIFYIDPKCFAGLTKIYRLSLYDNPINFKSFYGKQQFDDYYMRSNKLEQLEIVFDNFDQFINHFNKCKTLTQI